MDAITNHHSLARILTSLVESKGERPLTGHIAQQLSISQDGEEKAVLAEILASLLSLAQDNYSENILSDFVKGLVLPPTDDHEDAIHKNLQLGSKIALTVPIILTDLIVGAESTISALILAASKSHVASDDAFEVDMAHFLDKYCSIKLGTNREPESPELFQSLYPTVIQYLCFLKIALLSDTKETELARTYIASKSILTRLIISLIASRHSKISELSCHVFRLLLGNPGSGLLSDISEIVWEVIKILLGSSTHVDLAFSIWLRWVSLDNSSSRPSEHMLQQENYWTLLQNGLTTGFNERRKFCLYILNSSFRLLLEPIDNKLIKYDPSSAKDVAAWSKYSTMIEIISLSTSTNQFLATVPDLHRLLRPSSSIYGSWIVVLMTLGLTSPCGPLQKAVWEFLLSLDGAELGKLLQDERGKSFINDIFLPYSIAAHHFSVPKNNDRCEYGDNLTDFLRKVTVQSRDPAALLRFIDNRQDNIFAPARVYIMKGIMEGAVETSGHGLGAEEMAVLVRISKMKRFALLKTDLCISICFRILLTIKLDQETVEHFFDSMAEIFAGKEYLILQNFTQPLRELFVNNKDINGKPYSMFTELLSSFRTFTTEKIPSKSLFLAVFLVIFLGETDQNLSKVLDSMSIDKNRFRFLSLLFSCKLLVEGILHDSKIRVILTQTLQKVGNNLPRNVYDNGYSTELAALFFHQRTHHFLNQLPNASLLTILENSWGLIHAQGWVKTSGNPQRNNKFNLEAERLSSGLLVVCDAVVSALLDKGHRVNFPEKSEVLELISILPLPRLDQNKHENAVKLRVVSKFLYSGYSLLNTLISSDKEKELDDTYVTNLFDTTRKMLRYIDKGSLLRILECFQTVFRNAPSSIKLYPKLDLLVRELWDCADVTSAVAVESPLEVSLIRTIFDASVIYASFGTNLALAEILPKIGNDIMKLSKGKRSLAPIYASKLHEAYINAPEVFCACKWAVDIFIEFINYTPSKDPDFFVENSIARIFDEISSLPNHYEQYYEEREEMAQVYIFNVLSRLDPSSITVSEFANYLRDEIYAPWALNKPGMPVYSKWKKTSQLQVLVVLERFVTAERSASFIDTVISTLCNEPHPRYRFLLEWMAALCIIRFPDNRDCLWGYLQAPINPNPRLQASLLRVTIMVARELEAGLKEEFYTELLYTVIPLSNNNKVAVRHQATSMVLELWDDLVQWQHLRDNIIFQRLRQSILNSDFFKQVVAVGKLENERTFDAKANYTFAGIFSGNYLLGGDEADAIPPELFSSLNNHNSRASFISAGSAEQLGATHKVEFTKTEVEALVEAPLQTKSGGWDAKALVETNEHRRSKDGANKDQGPDIIVIASLIENSYNLGGLSRVSEIMGVNVLCFNSRDVLKLKDFTSVSVSSEIWLPIVELKVADIPTYIHARKLDGYSAVGIEQTDRSVILGDKNNELPKKVVLLLGSEKYGIPAELLAELDLCVEIPQKGETRSMNVQTAAAVVLYEFCRRFG